jgi:ABC-type transport system substrate-binding protein
LSKELVEAVSAQVKEGGFNMKVVAMEACSSRTTRTSMDFSSEESPMRRGISRRTWTPVSSPAWMGYHNEAFNKLLDEAGETFDVQKRNAIYQKLSKIVFDDGLYLMYYSTSLFTGSEIASRVSRPERTASSC